MKKNNIEIGRTEFTDMNSALPKIEKEKWFQELRKKNNILNKFHHNFYSSSFERPIFFQIDTDKTIHYSKLKMSL